MRIHGLRDGGTWGCAIGSGSQDLLYKAFQVFTDPGDSILIDTCVPLDQSAYFSLALILYNRPAYSYG